MSRKCRLLLFPVICLTTIAQSCREAFDATKTTVDLSEKHTPAWKILLVVVFGVAGSFVSSFVQANREERPALAYTVGIGFIVIILLCVILLS